MNHAGAAIVASMMAAIVAGCGSADKPKPSPLEPLTPKIAGRQVWATKVGSVAFPLTIAVNGSTLTLAGGDGTLLALSADDGREVWRANAGAPLAAGVGSDGRFAAVVTGGNEVVVVENGREKWRARVGSRVTTAPLVAGERVFVMGVDRVVNAFDALDGTLLWTLRRPGDALTLAQRGVVAAFKDTLLVGQGARLTGVDPLNGSVRWEVAVASPRGANEVERLAELVGPVMRAGEVVCVRAFQAAVGCVNAERGVLLWNKTVGGVEAIGGDAQLVVGADGSGRITAWRGSSGEVAWSSEKFLHRALSAPLLVGKTVVLGDFEGQLHFLDRDSGDPLLRLPTDGTAVAAPPIVVGSTIVVVTRGGGAFGFRPQ